MTKSCKNAHQGIKQRINLAKPFLYIISHNDYILEHYRLYWAYWQWNCLHTKYNELCRHGMKAQKLSTRREIIKLVWIVTEVTQPPSGKLLRCSKGCFKKSISPTQWNCTVLLELNMSLARIFNPGISNVKKIVVSLIFPC